MEEKNQDLVRHMIPFFADLARSNREKDEPIHSSTKTRMVSLPSVHKGTSYFRVELKREGEEGEGTEEFLLKYFLPGGEKLNGFTREGLGRKPARNECEIMDLYRKGGANVPRPHSHHEEPGIIIMEDMGKNSLERCLMEEGLEERKRLVSLALDELGNFHRVGRQIQRDVLRELPHSIDPERMESKAKKYFAVLTASEEEIREGDVNYRNPKGWKDFWRRFEPSVMEGIRGEAQLIHGDMTTYHVFINENEEESEEAWIVDLGNPDFNLATFDDAPLIFSQDSRIPIEDVKDVYIPHLEKSRLADVKGGSRAGFYREAKLRHLESLFNTAILANLRRSSKARILEVKYPDSTFEDFVSQHPTYRGCRSFYHRSTLQVVDYLLENSRNYGFSEERISEYEGLRPILDDVLKGNWEYDKNTGVQNRVEGGKREHKLSATT